MGGHYWNQRRLDDGICVKLDMVIRLELPTESMSDWEGAFILLNDTLAGDRANVLDRREEAPAKPGADSGVP